MVLFEEPPHHGRTTRPDCTDADREFLTAAINRQLVGADAETWVHTCWCPPHQQRVYWEPPSHERPLPYLFQLHADVITFESASPNGRELPLFAKYPTDKKIGIGVVNHGNTVVESPAHVARLIRKAHEHIPPERLLITTDCGFAREGLSRRIAPVTAAQSTPDGQWKVLTPIREPIRVRKPRGVIPIRCPICV